MSHLPADAHRRLEAPAEAAADTALSPAASWDPRRLLRQANGLRMSSPHMVTCPASRHVQQIAEGLLATRGGRSGYPMLQEDPSYCAASMLATVVNLFEARAQLRQLQQLVKAAMPANWEDDADTAALAKAVGVGPSVRGDAGA